MLFYITPFKTYNVIIGRKWFVYFWINLAITDRKLIWPRSLPPTYFFDKLIKITRDSIGPSRIDPYAQADAERRDYALDHQEASAAPVPIAPVILKKQLWTSSLGRHNYANEQRRALQNIDAILANTFQPSFQNRPCRSIASDTPPAKPLKIDLFEISAVAYNLIGKRKGYAAFVTSLDEINSLLASRTALEP